MYAARGQVSYAGVTAFTRRPGSAPDVVTYYSAWLEPFQAAFAADAARHGAVPLVQMEPTNISLAAIASGKYDAYLRDYAAAVSAYRHPVILSFGHEMNGHWFSWGYRHASPAAFVAAWRHIVTLFRKLKVQNVTWLWTVNVIQGRATGSPPPARGGPAVLRELGGDRRLLLEAVLGVCSPVRADHVKVRALTRDPILIAETAAAPAAGQAAKITDLFPGIRQYGLLGSCGSTPRTTRRIDGPPRAPRAPAAGLTPRSAGRRAACRRWWSGCEWPS